MSEYVPKPSAYRGVNIHGNAVFQFETFNADGSLHRCCIEFDRDELQELESQVLDGLVDRNLAP